MKEGNKQTYNDAEWWCLLLNEVMSWLECALCCVFLCCLVVNCQFGCLSSLRGWTSVTFWASGPLTASSLQNLTGSLGSLLAPHYKWPCVAPGFARRVCLCDSILMSCPFSAVRTRRRDGEAISGDRLESLLQVVQQRSRAGEVKLRCHKHVTQLQFGTFVLFVRPQCILCWRALCALLLLWHDNWEVGCT